MEITEKQLESVSLWETWQLRVLILISLLIQALLTFLAPYRKRCSKNCLMVFIWLLYLSADVVAIYVIGLISNSRCHRYAQGTELLALWASFLLLHLGGPDTVTALALEDNELWRRHALTLATQVTLTVLVFARSFRVRDNHYLLVPTVLMFFDGFIKYFERTCALFFASKEKFRDSLSRKPDPGPNYKRLIEEYFNAQSSHIPVDFEGKQSNDDSNGGTDTSRHDANLDNNGSVPKDDDNEINLIREAYKLYVRYKPLLAEGIMSIEDRKMSRDSFLNNSSIEDAYRIIEIELNFIYDTFYTKSFLLGKRRAVFRILCFVFVIVSLVLFALDWDERIKLPDAIITFILFFAAIALDISAAIMFVLSDWWLIKDDSESPRVPQMVGKIFGRLSFLKPHADSCIRKVGKIFGRLSFIKPPADSCTRKVMRNIISSLSRRERRPQPIRWSNVISGFNLLEYTFVMKDPCYSMRLGWSFYKIKIVRNFLFSHFKVKSKTIKQPLINFITKEIWNKALLASNIDKAKKVFDARGNLVFEEKYSLVSECLRPWTNNIDYDESLMVWHLATNICYYTAASSNNEDVRKSRGFSKALSDYMLYLVIWQQSLLSSVVGTSDIRLQDTCEAMKKFMDISVIESSDSSAEKLLFQIFSEVMLENNSEAVENIVILAKRDKSQSVLFDAFRLANQLEIFGEEKWEITSKVWVELLCYAAVHCSPRYHIAQLSKGGELLTVVWLFITQLGIGEKFLQTQGYGWTRLVIDK